MAKTIKITPENESKYFFDLNEDAIINSLDSVKSQLESWGVLPSQSGGRQEKIASARETLQNTFN